MSIRKRMGLAAGALTIAVAAALTGCAASTPSNASSTVTVMWASNEFTPAYIKDFEQKNPKIKIKFIEYDENRLNAMETAGNPPDLVRGSPSANLFARGLAAPLDGYLAKSKVLKTADLESVNNLWRWNGKTRGTGKIYGIIKDYSPDATIWQNTANFDKAGVAPLSTSTPASWDAVLDTAKQLKAKGIELPLGIEWQWGIGGEFQTMVEQQGGHIFNTALTKAQIDTPEGLRAIQWLIDYGKAGVGPTTLNPLADGQDAPSFMNGKMASTMDGFWFGGNLATADGATVAKTAQLVPAPTYGKRISPVLGGVGGWIPEASKNKDAAWKVMEYFMAGKPAVDRASSGWGLPALKSLWKLIPDKESYQKQAVELAKTEVKYVVPLQDSPYISFSQWNGLLDKELQNAIKGGETAKQVASSLQTQMNTLLVQGKDQLG
ncbi:ABC transporter substrate-binding protein [Lacisediminihabitans changchengi]|uniref:Extracellular solute-binding protein n=1 Tax=Lacisediminihabitans changchengi TaxID=2787634 RepID=A0A934W471_9MICO|nr:extracellular solute-binding protein [Lacisediminihabitans changchengi]MBK4348646.1 extracellular solute-binding protein [Lacisediminihabitans changchengi]